ncbi:helix-turn-helix transcriptional regulator [Pseudalkalibacillus sp. SCS-8]|uniref:helix-turn-helix transcriptional regulator n=1 Tax=Pseudalkalibacillus nanhaiensis TaxID=3115291 RepID=UPI0032D9F27A
MDRVDVIQLVSEKVRLIRVEQGFSQDAMANILGISKKTLVQIEKGRTNASWNIVIAVVAIFEQSEVLRNSLGDEPLDVIRLVALHRIERPTQKTMGGKVWWNEVEKRGSYRLQQNLISQHYRIIDDLNYWYFSSFNKDEAVERLHELNS